MGKADYYASGDWNAICDKCGKKYKASKLKTEWNGLIVCKKCFESRHPQDFVRGVVDSPYVPFRAPEGPDVFTTEAEALVLPPQIPELDV
jgi:hypothetical protein